MNVYLVIVLAVLQPTPGQSRGDSIELRREFISASTLSVCEGHAAKAAEEARRRHAAELIRLKASVTASCTFSGRLS